MGGQGANMFSNLMQPPAVNPYQIMPGVFQNHGPMRGPMGQPGPRQIMPQPANPFGQMFGGGGFPGMAAPMAPPPPMMMGGPMMAPGMPVMHSMPGFQPPMNQMFQVGHPTQAHNPYAMNNRGFGW